MSSGLIHVSLDFDPRLLARLNRHIDNLLAELRVIASGLKTDNHDRPVPAELADLIGGILTEYSEVHEQNRRRAQGGVDRGDATIRLEMDLPAAAAKAARDLLDALERADSYCRDELLLTLPADPDVAEFRRWYMVEVAEQVERG